jgi:hypothetical protein
MRLLAYVCTLSGRVPWVWRTRAVWCLHGVTCAVCVPARVSCVSTFVVCVGCVQICKSHPMDKKSLKTLILRQKDELRQHMDYLNSIRNYCG